MKKNAEKEQREREKKQVKKNLSSALRKNLMRRKAFVSKDDSSNDAKIVV
jgi:hypothetical protein